MPVDRTPTFIMTVVDGEAGLAGCTACGCALFTRVPTPGPDAGYECLRCRVKLVARDYFGTFVP